MSEARDRPGRADPDAPAGVVLVSGHLVDAPDRPTPRFPASSVAGVTRRIGAAFDQWHVGPGTVVISGGARGADIIGAEEARARDAEVLLLLALPADEFERRSVALPGSDWSRRFHRLLAAAQVRQLASASADVAGGDEVFARTNQWMVDCARRLHPDPRAVVVWDGKSGDGAGGTADLVRRLGYGRHDPRLRIIDPRLAPANGRCRNTVP